MLSKNVGVRRRQTLLLRVILCGREFWSFKKFNGSLMSEWIRSEIKYDDYNLIVTVKLFHCMVRRERLWSVLGAFGYRKSIDFLSNVTGTISQLLCESVSISVLALFWAEDLLP